MTFFPELSPNTYGRTEPDAQVLNVGRLAGGQPFARGSVSYPFFRTLLRLSKSPVHLCRGTHVCPFCEPPRDIIAQDPHYYYIWSQRREGNGEIRVTGLNRFIYVAPVLIVHYIAEHQYQPPEEFIDAVLRLDEAQ